MAFVDAPTEMAGFLLVVRMDGSRSENERHAGGRWIVRVPVKDGASIGTLLDRVQSWLRQERISETRVRVGDDVYCVGADHADLQQQTEGSR
jgi:hypothetical protein